MYRNMYFFLLFVAVFEFTASISVRKMDLSEFKIDYSCTEEAKISNNTLKQYENLFIGPTYNKKVACYNLCLAKNEDLANPDGTIKIDNAISTDVPEDRMKLQRFFNECKDKKINGNPCKTYFSTFMCFLLKVNNEDSSLMWSTRLIHN